MRNNSTVCDDFMKTSDDLVKYPSGGLKSSSKGKLLWILLPISALKRIVHRLTTGAEQYGARNWEKGIDKEVIQGALLRHTMQYLEGETDEDHLAAVGCNLLFLMHFENKEGVFPYKKEENNAV